ncbi:MULTISPECIES: hypothetical protein [unclassified Sphingobacterium]|uniref:hypothetical protein n=1 Tax=unclassified Sphingobacterium TaxID=2609468 RepID=UPI0016029816|nr:MULTISPECIES: hypothetical protein [unclassified Sphingobacterium]WET67996.1 MAG: hypothetical protein P0Y57_19325 [Sphingobacterium sp.]
MKDQLKAKREYIPPAIHATRVEMENAFGAIQVTFVAGTEQDYLPLDILQKGEDGN